LGESVVYRIHFTVEDLARTRVAQPPPLLELSAAVHTLQTRTHPVRFAAWRRSAFSRLEPRARMVLDLIPPAASYTPCFLAPTHTSSPQEALERARSTPRSRIREDLALMAESRTLPSWAYPLADDSDLLGQLFDSLEHVYDVLVAPHWAHIVDAATADRAIRARQAVAGGMEHLLASLHPTRISWAPPVLEISMLSGLEGNLRLEGSGLLLAPSLFGTPAPAIDIGAKPQPILRYPGCANGWPLHGLSPFGSPVPPATSGARSPLASLLGHTRAAVLHAVAEHPGCSTKELAALTGVSPASASEHATTLRTAGLIRTVRRRNTALHSPTALGVTLLNASPRPHL
jgi:DNA-binding transcriptional ArsR family regulator